MRRRFTRSFYASLLLVSLSTTVAAQGSRGSVCAAERPAANLDFTLKDLAGKDIPLSEFRGKVLLLNFWATWCVPCKIEIPAFNDLYKKYRGRGVEIVGVNVGESASVVLPYSQTLKINYPNLVAGSRTDILKAFDIDVGLPTTIVIDRQGLTCRRRVGLTRKDTFEFLIKALL